MVHETGTANFEAFRVSIQNQRKRTPSGTRASNLDLISCLDSEPLQAREDEKALTKEWHQGFLMYWALAIAARILCARSGSSKISTRNAGHSVLRTLWIAAHVRSH